VSTNARIADRDAHEIRVASEGSGSHSGLGTGSHTHGAQGVTRFVVDSEVLLDGLRLNVGGNSVTDEWTVTYYGPGAPLGLSASGSGWASVEGKIVIEALKVYAREIQLFKLFGTLKVYAQGVLILTQVVELDSAGMGVNYVPLIAMPLELVGGCTAGTTGLGTLPTTYSYSSTTNSVARGGYRWKEAGSGIWATNPVLKAPGAPAATPGGCVDPGFASVEADSTYELEIEGYAHDSASCSHVESGVITACIVRSYCDGVLVHEQTTPGTYPWDMYKNSSVHAARGGGIMAVPNLQKRIRRFNPAFGILMDRIGNFPQTTSISSASCTINGVAASVSNVDEVHPHQAYIRQRVGYSISAMEDTLAFPSYAPWNTSGTYSKSESHFVIGIDPLCSPAVICPPEQQSTVEIIYVGEAEIPPPYTEESSRSYQFPYTVEDDAPISTYHEHPLARYWASWCNPHWAYGYPRKNYPVFGSPVPWEDYEGKIGQQWLDDMVLPPSERTKQRNTIKSCPLWLSSYLPWLEAFRSGSPWVGICRWRTDAIDLEDHFDIDASSAARWSSPDLTATLTHGADLSINPSAGTCKVDFDLTSFTVSPYMALMTCNRVRPDWIGTNISAVRVKLISVTGEEQLLEQNAGDGFTTANVIYTFKKRLDTEYAGSHGQEFGAGAVANMGFDTLGEGRSVVTMNDEEQINFFQLFGGRQGAKLRFEIDVVNPAIDVTLKYPRFYTPDESWSQFDESRVATAMIWPNGPGVRWGQWSFYNPGAGLLNPPQIQRPGDTPSVIDALCARRVMFEGVAHNGGSPDLTTELSQLYDSFEVPAIGSVYKHSHAFPLPKGTGETVRIAHVDNVRECPPMAIFPRRERSSSTWLETGDYVQDVWVLAELNRYIIASGGTIHLWNADETVQLTTNWTTSVTGWSVVFHASAVDNNEGPTYRLKVGNTTIGRASPWDGYFEVHGLSEDAAISRGLANARSREGFYVEADARDGNLKVEFAYGEPHPGFDHSSYADESGKCSSPALVIKTDRSIWLEYVIEDPDDEFNAYRRVSTDDGRTWSDAELIGEGTVQIKNFFDESGKLYGSLQFRYDSGTDGPGKLYGRTIDGGDAAFSAEFTVKDQATGAVLSVKDEGFDIVAVPAPGRPLVLVCVIEGETERSHWSSADDARSFKRIT
jgi:hypothetical protein